MGTMRRTAAAAVLALAAVACGNGGTEEGQQGASSPPADAGAESTVTVEMNDEFELTADPTSVPAGTVTFEISSGSGPDAVAHAVTVIKTDLSPDELPLTPDDLVDVTAEGLEIVYAEAVTSAAHSAEVELEPGSYVILCNNSAHYARGEFVGFEVT